MRIPIFPALLFFFAVQVSLAPAREVDFLDFATDSSIETAEKSSRDAYKDMQFVSGSMLDHFAEDSGEQPNIAMSAIGPFGRITDPTTHDVDRTSHRFGVISLVCDGATYTPTWWLQPTAEIRRAAYFENVARIACEHGLPTRLLDAVIAQESGYNSRAISAAGAMGMMQIMPGTARSLGLARPFDPIANIRAGARYLRQQLDRFGRVDLALAAYNAGPERRSLKHGSIPRIPETINYVRTITTNWARLAELGQEQSLSVDRARAAMAAVNSSPYRRVELVSYD